MTMLLNDYARPSIMRLPVVQAGETVGEGTMIALIRIPPGYKTAAEFADDCGAEILPSSATDLLATLKLAEELLSWYDAQRVDAGRNETATPTSVLGKVRAAIAEAEGAV